MSWWDGKYSTSRDANSTLEDNIMNAGQGYFCRETSTGGTYRQTDSRIDVYGPSDSSKGHSHDWYNANTNEHGHHD